KITVIPPGVDVTRWSPARPARDAQQPVRMLFVGGDLHRKGGDTLLGAFRRLHAESPATELHLVTKSVVAAEPGVVVHSDMAPNSQALLDLYQACDLFCLPTRGDCLPMVLSEAGATGLPLVSTDVGAIDE